MSVQIHNACKSPSLFASILKYHYLQIQRFSLFTQFCQSPLSPRTCKVSGALGVIWSSESTGSYLQQNEIHMIVAKRRNTFKKNYLSYKCLSYKVMGNFYFSFAKDILKNYYETWMHCMNMKGIYSVIDLWITFLTVPHLLAISFLFRMPFAPSSLQSDS